MKAPMAKARIFTRTTLMPAPAADRSFARTASMAEPSRLRRSFATDTATRTSSPSTRRQDQPRVVRADRGGRGGTVGPPMSLPSDGTRSVLRNQIASRATASTRVTTATGRPRMRRAGMPTTTPTTAACAATIGATGNGGVQLHRERAEEETGNARRG